MFEFIGIVVVAWIGWVIVKSAMGGAIKGTLLRAATYAEAASVPRDFSRDLFEYPDVLKQARQELKNSNRNFAALDVYEQYGQAIIHLYNRARIIEVQRLKKEVGAIFHRQVEKADGHSTSYRNALYITAMTMALSKTKLAFEELKQVFDHCFDTPNGNHEVREVYKKVAWDEMLALPDLNSDISAMKELVAREIATKKFEFVYNNRCREYENYENGIPESELDVSDPHWYLRLKSYE